jgi:chemotaxis signal transduction protein
MNASGAFLLVRAGGESLGFALEQVREVVDLPRPRPVPARHPAVRGVVSLGERHLTLVHLGALLHGAAPPPAAGDTAVVVASGSTTVAFEVDGVVAVVDSDASWVGSAPAAWAVGVWRVGTEIVTVLDAEALLAQLAATEGGE